MNGPNMHLKVTLQTKWRFTYITLKWLLAFMHCIQMSFHVSIIAEGFGTFRTLKWTFSFMHSFDMPVKVGFVGK